MAICQMADSKSTNGSELMLAYSRGEAKHHYGTASAVEIGLPGARHHDVTVDARARRVRNSC